MIGLKQQLKGFTIGYAKEQALNIAGGVLNRFLTAYKEPYRVVVLTKEAGMPRLCAIARLQEKIEMRISSEWQSFLPTITNPLMRSLIQTAFPGGGTLDYAMATQRVWTGTKPLSVRLKMIFAEDVSAKEEVMDMCRNLQMLASPGTRGLVLRAPGPSPYGKVKDTDITLGGGGDIEIKVGTFLNFSSVIIDDLSVSYHARMSVTGIPIMAEVDMLFSTYQVITKEQIGSVAGSPTKDTIYPETKKREGGSFLEKTVDTIGDMGGSAIGGMVSNLGERIGQGILGR
jgi:hypothetical protein